MICRGQAIPLFAGGAKRVKKAHPTFGVIKDAREYLRSDAVARLCRFRQKEQRIKRINELI